MAFILSMINATFTLFASSISLSMDSIPPNFGGGHENSGGLGINHLTATTHNQGSSDDVVDTTLNLMENFVCGHDYEAKMGISPLAMVTTTDEASGLDVERNAFWLQGVDDDFHTMQQIKRSACKDATIPVIVFSMYPSRGLALGVMASHYMPEERIGSWKEYDAKLDYYADELGEIPSIIVMEPTMLTHTFNSEDGYQNTEYQLAFSIRVEKTIQKFKRSWVYVDVGNAMYLQSTVNLEHIILVLKKMPAKLRGFSMNVGSFINSTYNRQLAEEIYCQTGLHYIIDTSRNGGEFSTRSIEEINECTYDPPMTEKGAAPSWQNGAAIQQHLTQRIAEGDTLDYSSGVFGGGNSDNSLGIFGKRRRKRWIFYGDERAKAGPTHEEENPAAEGSIPAGGIAGGASDGNPGGSGFGSDYYDAYDGYDGNPISCVGLADQEGLDAFLWVKTPGESDGRMYPTGTFHPCLLGHHIECTDTCPQYVRKRWGVFSRRDICRCIDE